MFLKEISIFNRAILRKLVLKKKTVEKSYGGMRTRSWSDFESQVGFQS